MNDNKTIPSDQTVIRRIREIFDVLGFTPAGESGRPANIEKMADRIEHTLLNTGATDDKVDRLCAEASKYHFRSVCCLPRDVSRCRDALEGSGVLVVTVIDFPLAGGAPGDATSQCARAIEFGADEVDMVVDVRALVRGDLQVVRDSVASVVWAAGAKPVKVILETGLLSFDQIVDGCAASEAGGAHFVKTCTGFGPRGASLDDVRLMRRAVGERMGVKASGGIKNRETALAMVDAGADLLGTSSGPVCI